jgi:hypothetical protein
MLAAAIEAPFAEEDAVEALCGMFGKRMSLTLSMRSSSRCDRELDARHKESLKWQSRRRHLPQPIREHKSSRFGLKKEVTIEVVGFHDLADKLSYMNVCTYSLS